MDKNDIEWPFPELRWMGNKNRHVWIDKQHNEDPKKDGRNKEPFENLGGVGELECLKRRDEDTQVIAHTAMTKFASTRG